MVSVKEADPVFGDTPRAGSSIVADLATVEALSTCPDDTYDNWRSEALGRGLGAAA